jgi:3-hydroxy-9,10-secoandrosta-1,3,5(10)-triene-9,17-dione monooxygenase reductase component
MILMASEESFDPDAQRECLSRLASGLVILCGRDEGGQFGLTCQAFASLSLRPPLVVFAVSKDSDTWPKIAEAGLFGANVLSRDQKELALRFAKKGQDKFQGVAWRASGLGLPMIEGSLAFIGGSILRQYDEGDHFLVVGRVRELAWRDGLPLIFFKRGFFSIGEEV